MKRFLFLLEWDFLLQFRHGLYSAGFLLMVAWIMLIRFIPREYALTALPVVLLVFSTCIGFYFMGSIIFSEKQGKTFENLIVTPMKIREYLFSKAVTVSAVLVVSSVVLVFVYYGFRLNILLLLFSVFLTSVLAIFFGLIAVAKQHNMRRYALSSLLYFFILYLPLLDFLNIAKNRLFFLIPTRISLLLFQASFEPALAPLLLYSFAYLLIWVSIAYLMGHNIFYKYIVLSQGGHKR